MSVTGDTANRLGWHSAEVAHFSPQDSTTSMIGRARHSLSKMLPLNPRIGRYTYITLHLLAHPGWGHTNYSTKPEPILASGCTLMLLDMRIRLISLSLSGRSTSGAPPWISHACPTVLHHHSNQVSDRVVHLSLGPDYYFVTQGSPWTFLNPRLH